MKSFVRVCLAVSAVVCVSAAGAPVAAGGQEQPAPTAGMRGRVVDASTGVPLAGAEVTIRRLVGERGSRQAGDPSGPVVAAVATDSLGAYRFQSLAPAWYRLSVDRPGYRPRVLDVVLRDGPQARVSVAMDVEPIELTPIEVAVLGSVRIAGARRGEEVVGRVAAVRFRQERYLTSDSRLVTDADVAEAGTLAEPDIFRALQRLPGVSTRDDYTAELWTRGADWGETRVYLDGLPLFNPVHGFGVVSGVSSRALESATLHPGVRPVALPEGAAAVVDLRSRAGPPARRFGNGADVFLSSAQAWASGRLGATGGWSVTTRRSWLDAVAATVAGAREDQFPYAFWDVQATADREVGGGHALSVTALMARDAIRGELPDILQRTTARWGNALAAVTLEGPLTSGLRYRQTLGVTAYDAVVRAVEGQFDSIFGAPSERPADHSVDYLTLAGEVGPDEAGPPSWSLGYDIVGQRVRYVGPEAWPYSLVPPELVDVDEEAEVLRAGVWGHRRWLLTPRLTLDAGLRVTAGDEAAGLGTVEALPQATVRFRPVPAVSLVAAAARYSQYAQSPAPMGPRIEGVLQTGRRWVLASPVRPVIGTTVATLGGEAWLGDAWLASVTAYQRRSTGVLLPDPVPGLLVQRPPLVAGQVRSRGLETSVRRILGRVTGSAGYSLGQAEGTATGRVFDAPTDRTHVVDLSVATRLGRSALLSAVFTYASGAPYTRTLPCELEGCRGVVLDDPFGRRAPAYASLDLTLDKTHDFGGWTLGWFVQARNVLGHDNTITYRDSVLRCPGDVYGYPCPGGAAPVYVDEFVAGIPTVPIIGLRVAF